jgi:(p)ppGpp synthase/HD superfamily hydrolase
MVKQGQADPRFLAATSFAVEAHGRVSQERKGTTYPYVAHPLRVGEILYRHGAGGDTVVAGILHDVLEDTLGTEAELRKDFGPRVTEIVKGVTEPDKLLPRIQRMEETIDRLRAETDPAVWMVAGADKLDNVRTIRDTITERGAEETWRIFSAERPDQESYYRSMAETLVAHDPSQGLFRELALEVDAVFA